MATKVKVSTQTRKQTKDLDILVPLKTFRTVNLKSKSVTVALIHVKGKAYFKPFEEGADRFSYDIDEALYQRHNIKEVLEITDKWAQIEDAAFQATYNLFA